MKVIIIEDEYAAAQNLKAVIKEVMPDIKIIAVLESIEESVHWLQNNEHPDLAFFDIHLADGHSFEILEKTNVSFPVIFTTAYNEYAIEAFKFNSIDYILKPVNSSDVKRAILKFIEMGNMNWKLGSELVQIMKEVRNKSHAKKYKKAFLVHFRDKLIPIAISEIAYFFIESKSVFCVTYDSKKYVFDQKLDDLQEQINPDLFFRANRQYLVNRNCIKEISFYFNGRLVIKTKPESSDKIIISKAKASIFKNWLDN